MYRIFALGFALSLIAVGFSCNGPKAVNNSPTDAYKAIYAAAKAKDIDTIKKNITKKTIELGKISMTQFKKTEVEAYENAFTETVFSETLPSIRDERIKGNVGAIEVWNSKEGKWDDLPFILEDGSWKLAMGELFAGSFKTPAKGRDQIEKEAANAMGGGPVVLGTNGNGNAPANRLPIGNPANSTAK